MRRDEFVLSYNGQFIDQPDTDDDTCIAQYRLLMLAFDDLDISEYERRCFQYLYGQMAIGINGDMYFYTARA